jgi:beta-glucosidase
MNAMSEALGVVYRFPEGFLWGAATSSHQVEGNNRWNDWWDYEKSGQLPYLSGDACRHYELYEQDFDMAKSWGHGAHRFSIEWSRIEPEEGRWNAEAVAHYRDVIHALRERGLEPVVTLHHFSNPLWFLRKGGWLCGSSVAAFVRYVRYVAQELGTDVRYWITINEPTVYAKHGYVLGDWPPCEKGAWAKAARVLYHMAKAHRLAYRSLHQVLGDVMVGFAHSAPLVMPCDRGGRSSDRLVAWFRDLALNRAIFYLAGIARFGSWPHKRHCDFIGLNYYTRSVVRRGRGGMGSLLGEECWDDQRPEKGVRSDTDWEVYPQGILAVLRKFAGYGLPLLVSENGIATKDEALRSVFLREHLRYLAEALASGVNVIGYFYWTLMDNFEWALGTNAHFGLAAVDFETQQRIPRPCAEKFARVCCMNVFDLGDWEAMEQKDSQMLRPANG